jgi:hypothetical protein
MPLTVPVSAAAGEGPGFKPDRSQSTTAKGGAEPHPSGRISSINRCSLRRMD